VSYGSPPPPPGNQPPYGGNPYGQQPPYGNPIGGPASGDPGTLDLPYYGIGFGAAVQRAFKKYARFDGRASRSEYWWYALGVGLIFLVLYIPLLIGISTESTALTLIFGLVFLVFALATIVPSIAVGVRRLHDGGFSGWMYLLGFIPGCGGIIQLVMMCLPSKPEGAKYDRVGGGQNFGGGQNYGQGGYGNPYGQ
jgi:uncharacterized membrane protein YhaH (DUF805 family)